MWPLALSPLEVHDDTSSSSDDALRACTDLSLHDTPNVTPAAGTGHAFIR